MKKKLHCCKYKIEIKKMYILNYNILKISNLIIDKNI